MTRAATSKPLGLTEAALATSKKVFGAFWGAVPKYAGARLAPLGEGMALRTEFAMSDLQDWSSRKYAQTVLLGERCLKLPVEGLDARVKGVFPAPASARGLELRVVEGGHGSAGSDKEAVWIEVWDRDGEICRRKVPGAKDVIVSGPFGEPRWGPALEPKGCEPSKVVFCVEKSEAKFERTFFEWKQDDGKGDDKADGKADGKPEKPDKPKPFEEKYRLETTFGETLGARKLQGLVVFDWVADKFQDVSDKVEFAGAPLQPALLPSGDVVFACVERQSDVAKPGLSVCINRPTKLLRARSGDYSATAAPPGDAEDAAAQRAAAECLTPDLYFASAPVVALDGSRLLFFGVKEPFATHCKEVRLYCMDAASGRYADVTPEYSEDFLGFCFRVHEEMPKAVRWLPGSTHCAAVAFTRGVVASYVLEVPAEGRARVVQRLCPDGLDRRLLSVSISDVLGDTAVLSVQGFLTPVEFHLADLSRPAAPKYSKVLASPGPRGGLLDGLDVEVTAETITKDGVETYAWLLRHKDSATNPRPLMIYIHGGPHVSINAAFLDKVACAVAAGFHVVLPNYRGSASFGSAYLECLPGHAGDFDVLDCYNAALHAKERCCAHRVVAYGGSHGGFMTGWLVGDPRYKDLFSAGCLWNPASDLTTLALTSDIPEWSICEAMGEAAALSGDFLLPSTPEAMARMHAASPISVARGVKCPSLVVLGSGDVRCPWFMGLRWARSVEQAGGDVAVLNYPGKGHAIADAEFLENAEVTILAWLLSRLEVLQRASA